MGGREREICETYALTPEVAAAGAAATAAGGAAVSTQLHR